MGTEYAAGSFLGNPAVNLGIQSNLENRTELSVGRVILPLAYGISDRLSLGATYHSETRLSDMKTSGADVTFGVDMGGGPMDIPVSGEIRLRDFQWPEIYGIGAAWQASDDWFFTGDIKRIEWAGSMESFDMTFTADAGQADMNAAAFAGRSMDVSLFQHWDDQVVYPFGGAWRWSPKLTLRAGVNLSDNPVPNTYLNALFPAIVEEHYSAGFGCRLNRAQGIDFSLQYAPEVEQTSGGGVISRHSQTSFQFLYSHRF